MKQGHLLVMFLTVYVVCFMALYVEQRKYDNVLKEKQRVEQALLDASYTAARNYEKVINMPEEIRKNTVTTVFLESFYVSMGLFGSQEERDYLRMHLPVMILAETDGAFFFYVQEVQTDNGVEWKHEWSEKIPYRHSGVNSVLETIEITASDIVSNHNYIAAQYGISYQFHSPTFLQDTSDKIEVPMLFVVFQGWPLVASGDVSYENCVDASVYITEKELYTALGPETISQPFWVYHKSFCTLIAEENRNCIKNVSIEEAIQMYGAYPCEQCIKE